MKNAILMVAAMGMFGGALADSTTVVQPVKVTVANVCTYNPEDNNPTTSPPVTPLDALPNPAPAYSQFDVSGKTYTQQNTTDLGTYKANGTAMGSASTYVFRCTAGTSWTAPTGKTTIKLTNGTKNLDVVADRKDEFIPDILSSIGDIHKGSASFSIPTGQYSANAGAYTGNLVLEITYN